MSLAFDPRVVPEARVVLLRSIQKAAPCRLAGGAALSGVHLRHRLSRDLDLFFESSEALRDLVRILPDVGAATSTSFRVVRDAGTHVRVEANDLTLDLVYEPSPSIEPPERVEDVLVESWTDLRASKIACLLERSEPRDLVDICFIERAGFSLETQLPAAARKDAGIDPGTLAWLLQTFPVEPLPVMLEPFDSERLRKYRDDLAERLRRLTVG